MDAPIAGTSPVDFDEMLNGHYHDPRHLVVKKAGIQTTFVDLPAKLKFPPALAAEASPWLDEYIEFSRLWSPRAYDDFHEAVGLWVLSTTAARRVTIDLGGRRYPSLYIALAARTSIFAKSTTASIGQAVLRDAGLQYLLAPDDATPQAFVNALTARLPADWDKLDQQRRQLITHRIVFSGQRGWYFDEFGQKISAMMRDGGHMADFRSLLRRFDDSPDVYEYVSISRGNDMVARPYLALLANLTPADLAPYAKKGAALWGDGFWARFAFLTPPANYQRKTGKFPQAIRRTPDSLISKLRRWHESLGIPDVDVEEVATDRGVRYEMRPAPPSEQRCVFGEGVYDAWYRYADAMADILQVLGTNDLDGNYTRMADKALRIAMLLASLENEGRIEMRHWARAQQIAECWRRNLHNLYEQITEDVSSNKLEALEDKIMREIAERGPQTQRQLYTQIRGLDSRSAGSILESMVASGLLNASTQGKKVVYSLVAEV